MPYNVNTGAVNATNLLYKVIVDTVISAYRKSTPLLNILSAPDRRGANPEGNGVTKGFFDRFSNNYMYLDVVDQPIFATSTGTSAKIQSGTANPSQFAVQCKPIYSSVQYEDFANVITGSDKGAIKKMSQLLVQQMTEGFKRTINRQLWGDGSGTLALTSGTGTASSTIVCTLDSDRVGTMYLTKNMTIQIAGATGGTTIAGHADTTTISSVNTSTSTITVADSLTWTSAAKISASSPDGSAASTNELVGMQQLVVNTGTVQGVNIALLNQSQAHISTNSSQTFTVSTMQALRNACQIAKPNNYFCNQNVYNEIGLANIGDIRTMMGKEAKLDVGFEHVTAHQGTVDIYLDYDVVAGSLFMLNTDAFTLGILKDVYMLSGAMMRLPQYAIDEIAMGWVGGLGLSIFDAQAQYKNITLRLVINR